MAARLRIAYLTSAYARAGDTFIRREVEELRRLGFEVLTFSIRREPQQAISEDIRREQDSTDYILERGAITLILALIGEFVQAPLRVWRAYRRSSGIRVRGIKGWVWNFIYLFEAAYLAQRLRYLGVAHLHNHIAENSATVAMIASEITGISFSMTVHGPREFYMVSQIGLSEKITRSKFVACISAFTRSQCMAWSVSTEWHKLRIVRCGLGHRFQNVSATPVEASCRFVHIGRLCPDKGQILLAEAAAQLALQGYQFTLEIIGDGPDRTEIERTITHHKLERHVKLLGWQNNDEVQRALDRSSVMVLPSFGEGLPVVIMEALAMERPVISTYIAGIPELVVPGENGWLVPAGDIDALAAAMKQAIETPVEKLQKMGRAGRARVLERHNIQTEVSKLAELFKTSQAQ